MSRVWILVLLLPLIFSIIWAASAKSTGLSPSTYPQESGQTKGQKIPIEVVGERPLSQEEMNQVESMARELVERNLRSLERNGIRIEKVSGGVRAYVERNEGSKLLGWVAKRMKDVNVEELRRKGIWKRVERKEGKVEVSVARFFRKKGVIALKHAVFDENSKVADVEITITAAKSGTYLVEENLPKGSDVDMNESYLVLNFDPVIAWVVELNAGGEATVRYRVRTTAPPELEPQVERLAGCDVEVQVEKVVRKGNKISGQFRILLGGTPVYTKNVKINGEWSFVKDGMYYVFQGEEPLTIEGRVGDCRFFQEVKVEGDNSIIQIATGTLLLALIVAAYLLFRT